MRVRVVEDMATVVAFNTFKPRKVFDVGTGQAPPRSREIFLDTQQVDGRAGGCAAECLPGEPANEGMVLLVEKSGGALDIGVGFGAGYLPLESLPRDERLFNWRTNSSRWFYTTRYSVTKSPLMSFRTSKGAACGAPSTQ